MGLVADIIGSKKDLFHLKGRQEIWTKD